MNFRSLGFISMMLSVFVSEVRSAVLKGRIKPEPQEKTVFLYVFFGDQLRLVDSASLRSGKFEFKSQGKGFPAGMYKAGFSPALSATLILGSEDISMEVQDRNWENAGITGSQECVYFNLFRTLKNNSEREMRLLDEKFRSLLPLAQTNRTKFESEVNKLKAKLDSTVNHQQEQYRLWSREEKVPYFRKLMRMLLNQTMGSVEEFLSPSDLKDDELARSDVWDSRINGMLQQFGQGDPEKWAALGTQAVGMTAPKTIMREIILRSVAKALQPLEQNGINAAYQTAKQYSQEFPGRASSEFLKNFNPGPPAVGEMAPEIELANREGVKEKLSSLRGKVVLLDFWASWRGPCRQENPNVVKAWKRFEPKGFTVFSVSLDQSKEKWLAAITKDGLLWNNHVSDLKGWQSAGAAGYRVNSIPATFLIDREGKIIAKNLRGAELDTKLEEILDHNLKQHGR